MTTTGPGAHAEHSPSSSHRWMHCPGSIAAERGLPDEDTIHSQEGTAMHALAEMAFQRNRPCEAWLGDTIEGIVITHDMAEAAQVYVDVLRDYAEGADIVRIEDRLDLTPLRPVAPVFGTCDAWFHYRAMKRLRVADFKSGKGVVVEADDNSQLLTYALMAWVALAKVSRPQAEQLQEIEVTIVQPRAFHADGPVRSQVISLADLKQFGKDLLAAVRRTTEPDAPRLPGEHCRWCKAKLTCGEFRGRALAVAQVEFADVATEGETVLPPDPMTLTPGQMGAIFANRKVLTSWLDVVEKRILGELLAGRVVPGVALKPKRANRKWRDEAAVRDWARKQKLKKGEIEDVSLKSPAQLEKVVKKVGIPLPEDLTVRESSGMTLCADTDPAALIPEAEFTVLAENTIPETEVP